MFMIAIPQTDIPLLNNKGCNVTINGQQTVLRREGDYLCYGEDRCKILDEHVAGDNVQFCAASHGAENEPHCIIRPDGMERRMRETINVELDEGKLEGPCEFIEGRMEDVIELLSVRKVSPIKGGCITDGLTFRPALLDDSGVVYAVLPVRVGVVDGQSERNPLITERLKETISREELAGEKA